MEGEEESSLWFPVRLAQELPQALWLQAGGVRGQAPGKGPADVESVLGSLLFYFLLIFIGGQSLYKSLIYFNQLCD